MNSAKWVYRKEVEMCHKWHQTSISLKGPNCDICILHGNRKEKAINLENYVFNPDLNHTKYRVKRLYQLLSTLFKYYLVHTAKMSSGCLTWRVSRSVRCWAPRATPASRCPLTSSLRPPPPQNLLKPTPSHPTGFLPLILTAVSGDACLVCTYASSLQFLFSLPMAEWSTFQHPNASLFRLNTFQKTSHL